MGHLLRLRPRRIRLSRRCRLARAPKALSIVKVAAVSVHALAGLFALNVLFLVSRCWHSCGSFEDWETWIEVARLAGLAYLIGVVLLGSLWTLLLIVGCSFLALDVVLGRACRRLLSAALVRRRRGRGARGAPSLGAAGKALSSPLSESPLSGVLLEGFFRAVALIRALRWDAWSFWIPKAKAIYFFGELDVEFFKHASGLVVSAARSGTRCSRVPFMGGPDVVTLHVQYWLLGVGFVWALAGLLAERVPAWILWPFVLLLLVAPRMGRRFLIAEADLLLDFLFVLACLLVVSLDPRPRTVEARGRDGADVWDGAHEARGDAPRRGSSSELHFSRLLVSGASTWPASASLAVVVALVAAPWRIWYVAHGVAGESPTSGGLDPTENQRGLAILAAGVGRPVLERLLERAHPASRWAR